ncbi:MAG: methylmalonyl Co-A mutase-associated GTPase MeaB [Candidatus Cloacimonetes bacterium]|jgi:LAO/AO transport system kinase|nr:methylmalonyl Co-A mutase-associated GTPase MeaB [Candidatus Cloacimonadota bacterium]MDD3282227.1 methylmalonyl Co-A mutase-associated GTPase MeaB [Candidatus Cloacimonadota bacterium]MDY0299513.1 methylmalonyl Co-A mutase-associated GTPase MeaB [Candidatus Cloacimonadaceae bacterium]
MNKRKPEWTPENAGVAFASSVISKKESVAEPHKGHPRKKWDLDALESGVIAGNRTILAKAITLVESNSPKHFEIAQELLKRLLPLSGNSIRIGITGVPGVGKSSFIERFGLYLAQQRKKIAVLAVDPSSTLSHGSILGDKTRMEELARNQMSFIRPSPAAGVLGGVARKTRESIVLCEAAGFEVILIETVGVGQSETTVRSMVDFFLLMQIAGAGDELQGIKKGIMELADLIVVNKADGDNIHNAELASREYNNALHYIRNATKGWKTKALTCSSQNGVGIPEIWKTITEFQDKTKASGIFTERRLNQVAAWFEDLISEAVLTRFYQSNSTKSRLPRLREQVAKGEIPVALAVSILLEE